MVGVFFLTWLNILLVSNSWTLQWLETEAQLHVPLHNHTGFS